MHATRQRSARGGGDRGQVAHEQRVRPELLLVTHRGLGERQARDPSVVAPSAWD
jgi:hypothetical protein